MFTAGTNMWKIIIWLSLWGLAVATKEDHTEEYEDFVVPFNGQKFDMFDWQLCTISQAVVVIAFLDIKFTPEAVLKPPKVFGLQRVLLLLCHVTLAKVKNPVKAVAEANPGNVLISPISVKFLLNMLYEGSSGETAKELEKVLQLPEDKTVARMKTSAVLRSLRTPDPSYVMEIGTKIFVDQSLTPKNWFQRILFLYYNAYIEKINFTDPKASVDRVNHWVESVTHGHIKDLITDGNFNQAVMLLVNAVYFKGTWKSFFQPEEGFKGNFETSNGLKKVNYMKQTNYFYYSKSEDIKAQILRLPYLGQKFAMYIILPEKKDGLVDLIKEINPFVLRKHIWHMEETSVEVILPKFKFQYKSDLKDVLRKVGLNKIFDSYGEMKGLIQNKKSKNLVVSNVIQKSGIEVNEEGSVAAAATEMQLINKIGVQDELFNASHPFLFFIEDETTGTVVFVGKFMHPEPEAEDVTPLASTTSKPQAKPQQKVTETPKRGNATQQALRRTNSPKLFDLKQKKIRAEIRGHNFAPVNGVNFTNDETLT